MIEVRVVVAVIAAPAVVGSNNSSVSVYDNNET